MVHAGAQASPQVLARFRVEAEAVARLQHPNIVQIHEVGQHAGSPFLVLELVEGRSLAQWLAGTPQPAGRAAELVETLARAIHAAHRQGVVHRDLTPANILLAADGVPKITDFGLAKLLIGGGSMRTQTGDLLGTPSYMAPEQADSRAPGDRGGDRRLRPGGDPLRAAHRPAAVQGGAAAGDPAPGRRRRAGLAVAAAAQAAPRPGDDLPEVPAEGAGPALCHRPGTGRRPAAVPGGPADPGAAEHVDRAVLAVVPAQPRGWPAANIAAAALTTILAIGATIAAWTFYAPARPDQPGSPRCRAPGRDEAREQLFESLTAQAQRPAVQPAGRTAVREPGGPGPGGRDRPGAEAASRPASTRSAMRRSPAWPSPT